ncbi:MAG: hypothetical protein IPM29_27410 [Planctomycetes bacterium]|nr:hypothetical protein [Planctomycetota bacterium]
MQSLPPEIRAVVARIEAASLCSPVELRQELRDFEHGLDRPDRAHPFADHELARRIAAGCQTLLEDHTNHAPERLRLVQVAVRYLILDDDAESDRESILGFDDDARVFDAIARALGRPDLCLGDHLG